LGSAGAGFGRGGLVDDEDPLDVDGGEPGVLDDALRAP
jgi:hypothetical protein